MTTDSFPQKPIEPRPEFVGILRENQAYATGADGGPSERINGWFDRLMVQLGSDVPAAAMLLLCILSGLMLSGIAWIVQENYLTAAVAALIGWMIPIAAALIIRDRRQMKMLRQMPGMVDELARAAKTGRSLEHCFAQVAFDTPKPLGSELQLCARKLQMGLRVSAALDELPERTGLVSLNVLTTALSVHQQTGGDLVQVLERLAHTIRDRLTFLGRLRAATSASRATAILMIVLPPAILAFFIFRDPDYFSNLISSQWGRNITILAVILQVIGSVWILRILKTSQRT